MAKRLPQAGRRRQILDAAIGVFARAGFRGTTTRQIAAAAGVSEATVFLYFRHKCDLYAAILDEKSRAQEPLLTELGEAPAKPLPDALTRIATRILTRHRRDQAILRLLLFSALEGHSLAQVFFVRQLRGPFQRLTSLLREATRRGRIRQIPVERAARVFVGILLADILWCELFERRRARESAEHIAQEYVKLYLDGVAPGVQRLKRKRRQ